MSWLSLWPFSNWPRETRSSRPTDMIELPVVDLQHYKATADHNECLKAAESLHKYGVLCLRDEVRGVAAFCSRQWLTFGA